MHRTKNELDANAYGIPRSKLHLQCAFTTATADVSTLIAPCICELSRHSILEIGHDSSDAMLPLHSSNSPMSARTSNSFPFASMTAREFSTAYSPNAHMRITWSQALNKNYPLVRSTGRHDWR